MIEETMRLDDLILVLQHMKKDFKLTGNEEVPFSHYIELYNELRGYRK